MLPDLNEIKARRKQFNLTQAQLAQLSGVSQSLIAKIESDAVVPSYDNAKRILDALEKLQDENKTSAVDIMQKHVFVVHEKDSAKRAVTLMEKKAVSQLPVLSSNGACVGAITEENVLKKIGKIDGAVNLASLSVSEIMDDALPTIQQETPFRVVQSILEHSPAALVVRKGKIHGIVTKADLLKAALKKR